MNKNTAFAAEAEQMDHVRTVIDSMTADMRDHPDPRLAMEAMLEAVAKAVCAEAGTLWFYHRFEDGRISPMAVYGGGELEGFYLRQHGEENDRQIACALLEDLMEAGPLKAAPSLSFLGLAVMDELCARHITSPVLH